MQPSGGNKKRISASRRQGDSLDRTQREIDLKMVEALARIERVRSKALAALGTMISAG